MAQTLPNDLRSCIASKEALVVVGAGVSIASAGETDVASWTGLLRNGVARCAEVCGDLPAGWSERVLAEIESGDMDDLLSAAEKVSRKLGAPDSGEYSRWLRETAGSLRVRNPDLIRALSRLEVPLATTNYDALLEQVTGRSAITWRDAARFERFIRGDEDAILHLHGYWEQPWSVVLGIRSYEKLLSHQHAQALLHAVRAIKTMVFVGFGAGLRDPNFGALLRWSQRLAESEYRHYRLAQELEVAELQTQHPPSERVFVVAYGKRFSDLTPFLQQLAPRGPPPCETEKVPRRPKRDRRRYDLRPNWRAKTRPDGRAPRDSDKTMHPDLWTPGHAKAVLVSHYEELVGQETANELWTLSQAGVSAVAGGDFARQIVLGEKLVELAPNIDFLKAKGTYFAAEGLRLLAVLEKDSQKADEMQNLALEKYHSASDVLPQDPSPLRGIGRTLQVMGKYDEALAYYVRAKGLCLTGLASADAEVRLDLAHEILRTSRHLIHCYLEIMATNALSLWNRENKRHELEGLLVECENFHRERMPAFRTAPSWWLIEWFMGLVLIARAWAQLGRPDRARTCFVHALDARRKLLGNEGELNAVERDNLRWWLATARDSSAGFDSHSRDLIERMGSAIESGQLECIRRIIDDLLLPMLPPWNERD